MKDPLSRLNRGSDVKKNDDINNEEQIDVSAPKVIVPETTDDAMPVIEDIVDDKPQTVSHVLLNALREDGMLEKSPKTLREWFDKKIILLQQEQDDRFVGDINHDKIFDDLLGLVQSYRLNHFNDGMGDKDGEEIDETTRLVLEAKDIIAPALLDRIDATRAATLSEEDLRGQIEAIVSELLLENDFNLNKAEQDHLVATLLNDMLGFGPLEPILNDEDITDILVNGYDQIYVERKGKLELSPIKFRNNDHVMNIATRIVTGIGRRIDETTPLCDARLPDGSRVNIIIPPLALDGPSISIRKFPKHGITLDVMARQGNISENMATVLKIASRSRLNILISGGTGSGKTTTLNAMSQMIDAGERIVTIEDAAELQLQQPHVVRLETRPPNLEGDGQITMRDLVKNSLRMRPDRVILGEIRGSEAVDMLQAMNTGHDGSLCTIHANNPREALTRLENMVGMAGINLPAKAVRTQISSAVDLIIQVSRMRDGMRRITHVTEIVGMEGDVVTTQDLFVYEFTGEGDDGKLTGEFKSSGLRPYFVDRANYFGLERALLAAMGVD